MADRKRSSDDTSNPKKPKVQKTSSLADAQERLDSVHTLFFLRPAKWVAFRALAEQHILRGTNRAALAALSTDALSALTRTAMVTFFTTHGPYLFPLNEPDRGHLGPADGEVAPFRTRKSGPTHIGLAGPIYLHDGMSMSRNEKGRFRDRHGGEGPTDDEQIACSKMGSAMQMYFGALVELMKDGKEKDGQEGDTVESAAGGEDDELLFAPYDSDALLLRDINGGSGGPETALDLVSKILHGENGLD